VCAQPGRVPTTRAHSFEARDTHEHAHPARASPVLEATRPGTASSSRPTPRLEARPPGGAHKCNTTRTATATSPNPTPGLRPQSRPPATRYGRPLPNGVRVHEDVDFTLDDPAAVDYTVNAGHAKNARRRCVATRLDEQRCASRAMHTLLVCALHAGRMTPEQGHTAKRTRAQEREARAEQALALQRMGTRAVVAEVLVQKAEKVARTVEHLLDAGAAGDLAAAKALVPWIDQAYGKPTERVEYKYPSSIEELEQMDEADLERLVHEGRQQRLQRLEPVPSVSDWRRRDPKLGVVERTSSMAPELVEPRRWP
jgi:hypothetical protein